MCLFDTEIPCDIGGLTIGDRKQSTSLKHVLLRLVVLQLIVLCSLLFDLVVVLRCFDGDELNIDELADPENKFRVELNFRCVG